MCAGLTEDEIAAANADEEFKQYMNGDTGKGDSGKFSSSVEVFLPCRMGHKFITQKNDFSSMLDNPIMIFRLSRKVHTIRSWIFRCNIYDPLFFQAENFSLIFNLI